MRGEWGRGHKTFLGLPIGLEDGMEYTTSNFIDYCGSVILVTDPLTIYFFNYLIILIILLVL